MSDVGNPYYFTARRYDAETGLYYYRARHYSPTIGRFLQTDPIGYFGGLNLYTYCGNNPINWVDPLGWCKEGGPATRADLINLFELSGSEGNRGIFREGYMYGSKGNSPGGDIYDPGRETIEPTGPTNPVPAPPKAEEKSKKNIPNDPTPKDPTPYDPTKGPPYPDEVRREARWWEWVGWAIGFVIYEIKNPPGSLVPPPVPPTDPRYPGLDWPEIPPA